MAHPGFQSAFDRCIKSQDDQQEEATATSKSGLVDMDTLYSVFHPNPIPPRPVPPSLLRPIVLVLLMCKNEKQKINQKHKTLSLSQFNKTNYGRIDGSKEHHHQARSITQANGPGRGGGGLTRRRFFEMTLLCLGEHALPANNIREKPKRPFPSVFRSSTVSLFGRWSQTSGLTFRRSKVPTNHTHIPYGEDLPHSTPHVPVQNNS